jgi:hypothetical protein
VGLRFFEIKLLHKFEKWNFKWVLLDLDKKKKKKKKKSGIINGIVILYERDRVKWVKQNTRIITIFTKMSFTNWFGNT